MRETLGNANQNKTIRAEYKNMSEKKKKKKKKIAFGIKGALSNAKQNTHNNSHIEEGQRKSPKMNQSNCKGALWKTTRRRTEPYKMLKRTTKPLRRRVLTEECPAKRSEEQHSQNTDKRHLRKAGSFSYGELPWTPALEGTSLFTTCLHLCVKSHCHRLLHVDYPWKSERNTRKC